MVRRSGKLELQSWNNNTSRKGDVLDETPPTECSGGVLGVQQVPRRFQAGERRGVSSGRFKVGCADKGSAAVRRR
ncbi:hypothetical protein PR202_ga16574 [Eleusine coracana subsp. coracana]|uniref:Uncharacterized protein n=1 Tax=Eleusine coracana subsp. coracana TaxID=191504 RepID=A0AAV5CLZ6_ELECO|nr:hypothetical protein PR202_ga16574 [Eleusine coracana subsp. coracana]